MASSMTHTLLQGRTFFLNYAGKAALALLVGGSMASLTGCTSQCASLKASPDTSQKETAKAISNGYFADSVRISNPALSRQGNDLDQGRVKISNLTDESQLVQYRFIWLEPNGNPSDDKPPWTPLQIQPGLSKIVKGMAPLPKARNYKLQACMLNPTNNMVPISHDD